MRIVSFGVAKRICTGKSSCSRNLQLTYNIISELSPTVNKFPVNGLWLQTYFAVSHSLTNIIVTHAYNIAYLIKNCSRLPMSVSIKKKTFLSCQCDCCWWCALELPREYYMLPANMCAIGHVCDDECGTDTWVASISNNQISWSHLWLYSFPVAIRTKRTFCVNGPLKILI